MKVITTYLFWASLSAIFYTYFIYPLVLFVIYALSQLQRDCCYLRRRNDRRVRDLSDSELPTVSFVIAVRNEEENLPAKLHNLNRIDYPAAKREIIFVSDGSTDRTNEILASTPDICLIVQPEHRGKAAALNSGIDEAKHEILILSDASTLFECDAARCLVRHFADATVGAVCGALQLRTHAESAQTEGTYWKYESMLRLMEARLGATLTASGAIYALRRNAFVPFAPGTLIDDFVAPLNARQLGLRIVYDPEAMATDVASPSIRGEYRRRVRIAIGSFRALRHVAQFRLPAFTWFAFIPHKLFRWLVPLFYIAMALSNLFLLHSLPYFIAFVAQLTFFAWAAVGFLWHDRLRGIRFALLGYFLFAMNAAFLVGLVRAFGGGKQATWQRAH